MNGNIQSLADIDELLKMATTDEQRSKLQQLRRRILDMEAASKKRTEMRKNVFVQNANKEVDAGYAQGVEDGKNQTEYELQRYSNGIKDGRKEKEKGK